MDPMEPENLKTEEIAAGNKEPSFKLNEPVTMALNISPLVNVDANEDESLSFIVLGKDSVEAQASLLASYVDIQQKSMSIVRISQFNFYLMTVDFEIENKNIFSCRITSQWCHH